MRAKELEDDALHVPDPELLQTLRARAGPLGQIHGLIFRNANDPTRRRTRSPRRIDRNAVDPTPLWEPWPHSLHPGDVLRRWGLFGATDNNTPPSSAQPSRQGKRTARTTAVSESDDDPGQLGAVGMSQSQRMGSLGPYAVAPRRGNSLIHGSLRVTHSWLPAATLLVQRWATDFNVEYRSKAIIFNLEIFPQSYEAFMVALRDTLKEHFTFQSKSDPPMFIVEVAGSSWRPPSRQPLRLRHGTAAPDQWSPREPQADSDGDHTSVPAQPQRIMKPPKIVAQSPRTEAAARRQRRARANEKTVFGRYAQFSDDDVQVFRWRQGREETSRLLQAYFLEVAMTGELEHMRLLINKGLPVEIEKTSRSRAETVTLAADRIEQLRQHKWDEFRETGGEAINGVERVYPNVNGADKEGNTALHYAAQRADPNMTRLLLDHGAVNGRKNKKGHTPLMLAQQTSHAATVALARAREGARARHQKLHAAQVMQLLDDRSLLKSAQDGDIRRVRFLLWEKRGTATESNIYGMTPLHFALLNRDHQMTELLIEYGASLQAKSNTGVTPEDILEAAGNDEGGRMLREVVEKGKQTWQRAMDRERMLALEERRRKIQEQEDQRLAKELRRVTAGTTAATSVFPAFPSDAPDRDARGTLEETTGSASGRRQERRRSKRRGRRRGRRSGDDGDASRNSGSDGSNWDSSDLGETDSISGKKRKRKSTTRSKRKGKDAAADQGKFSLEILQFPEPPKLDIGDSSSHPADGRHRRGKDSAHANKRLFAAAASALPRIGDAPDPLALSWNRHAIEYCVKRARASAHPSGASAPVAAKRPIRSRKEALAGLSSDPQEAARHLVEHPTGLEESFRTMEAPRPDDAAFDDWLYARFGAGV